MRINNRLIERVVRESLSRLIRESESSFNEEDFIRDIEVIYDNTFELYDTGEWLIQAMAKKHRRGVEVTLEHLTNSSTIKTIVRKAIDIYNKNMDTEPVRVSPQLRKKLHEEIGIIIWNRFDEEVNPQP